MRRYAISVAAAGFFLLAAVGLINDVPVFVCAMRGLVGAVVLFLMAHVSGRIVLRILVDTIVAQARRSQNARKSTGERRGP